MEIDKFKKELKRLLLRYDALIEVVKEPNDNLIMNIMVYDTKLTVDKGIRFVELTEDKL